MSLIKLEGISDDGIIIGQNKLISFKNLKGKEIKMLVPASTIKHKGKIKVFLANHGYPLDKLTKDNLTQIEDILSKNDAPIITLVRKLGFHNNSYLNSTGEVWGENDQHIMLNPDIQTKLAKNSVKGSLKLWKKNVAPYALNSSRLMLVLTVALSGMLLKYSNIETGGIHLFGDSSTGKSTSLMFGASIFGNKDYIENWCGTETAFEELIAGHNDSALFLDELKLLSSDPKQAAEKVMMLIYKVTEGQAKKRSKNYQEYTLSWSGVSLLSAGEVSLEQTAINGKTNKMNGERVRVIDVPADAGCGLGIYESLPEDIKEASDLSDKIKLLCEQYNGAVKRNYIEGLINIIKSGNCALENEIQLHVLKFIKDCHVDKNNGQMVRFANRFAIAYAAGMIGIKLEILPYKKKDIFDAVNRCYQSALSVKPMSNEEKVDFYYNKIIYILNNKNKYLDLTLKTDRPYKDINKKRFVISMFNKKRIIGIHSRFLKRILTDLSLRKAVLQKLNKNGLLVVGTGRKNTIQLRYKGKALKRRYCFKI